MRRLAALLMFAAAVARREVPTAPGHARVAAGSGTSCATSSAACSAAPPRAADRRRCVRRRTVAAGAGAHDRAMKPNPTLLLTLAATAALLAGCDRSWSGMPTPQVMPVEPGIAVPKPPVRDKTAPDAVKAPPKAPVKAASAPPGRASAP
jgi:hypothetical protein